VVEYRTSAHALSDIKYHVVWITKYRYKILRGDVAERARDLIRQICESRELKIIRGAVSPDHIHLLMAAPPHLAPSKTCSTSRAVRPGDCRRNFLNCESDTGVNIFGRAAISVRRWGRLMKKQSWPILKIKSGTTTIRASRSPRPPSLEPALSRKPFRRLQPYPSTFSRGSTYQL
jgi:REP element-mobilizing transposase RayT